MTVGIIGGDASMGSAGLDYGYVGTVSHWEGPSGQSALVSASGIFIPRTNNLVQLGSATRGFASLYLCNQFGTVYLIDVQDGSLVCTPAT